ncbi:fungal-specific transcription factor domain-containing protein [Mycena polygramma]|nr:fungal-specific transcription factor domain-containing protein [Mycena polygramma]
MIRSLNASESQPTKKEACLSDDLLHLKLDSHEPRFFGRSSGAALVKTAAELKAASGYATPSSSPRSLLCQPWKPRVPDTQKPQYVFPSPDLLATLVDLYFEHSNIYQPLLHRPTFARALADNLHLRDDKFGANVLLVCAVASRFSDDPRVFDAAAPLDCGWSYYTQVPPLLENLFETPSLVDLQRLCLAIQFLEGASTLATWTLVGMGIRMAQDAGAHRRQPCAHHTVEAELWRRAFWILISYDRVISSRLGRPCAMQYHDFDVPLPTECDDEYWQHEDPACSFRQPPGKPSRVAFFNSFLRLNNILAFSLYLLYSLQLRIWGDSEWEEVVVAELNSVLTKWADTIPEHLCWDPNREDPLWFKQSVALYCSYYYVQMTTHRPLIAMVRETPPSMHALPSLGICTNAARSCSHVADVWYQRMGCTPAVILLPALTTAGIVLLLNMWSGKRTGVPPQMNTEIAEVQKCVQAMRVCESRWPMAGFYCNLLNELGNVGQVPVPATQGEKATETKAHTTEPDTAPPRTHKRSHSDSGGGPHVRMEVWPDSSDSESPPFAWVGAAHEPVAGEPGAGAGSYSVSPRFDVSFAAALHAPSSGSQHSMAFPNPNPNPNQTNPTTEWASMPPAFPNPNPSPTNPTTGWATVPLPSVMHRAGPQRNPTTSAEGTADAIDDAAIAMWANAPTNLE